jgi:hypothetical protein
LRGSGGLGRPSWRRNPSLRLHHARCLSRGAIARQRARALAGVHINEDRHPARRLRWRLTAISAGNRKRLTAYIWHETSWHETDGTPPRGSCGLVGGARACANRFPDAARERRRVRHGAHVSDASRQLRRLRRRRHITGPEHARKGGGAWAAAAGHGSSWARPAQSPRSSPARMARPSISAGARRGAASRPQGRRLRRPWALAAASFIRILADPRPRMGLIDIRPAASHLLRKLVRQPSAFVGGIVLSTRMLQQ